MFSRIWLINLALAFCVALLGLKAYGAWSKRNNPDGVADSTPPARVKPAQEPIQGFKSKRLPPESNFETVISKDLFSPERTCAAGEEGGGPGPEPVGKAEAEKSLKGMSLYGVVMADGYQKALVMDKTAKGPSTPGKAPGTPGQPAPPAPGQALSHREGVWVKVGDTVGDFKVTAISPEKISLETGGAAYDLLLHDKENPKTRAPVKTASVPPVVIQAGTGSKPASQPAAGQSKPGSTPSTSQPGGGHQVPAKSQTPAAQAPPKPSAPPAGTQAQNPFQPEAAGKTAVSPASQPGAGSADKGANPFLKALQNKGILPNK